MSEYPWEDKADNEFANRKDKPQSPQGSEVKRSFDFLTSTPGMLRKGVARHGDDLRGFVDYNFKPFRSTDREWALFLEWVDEKGGGHRITLPHELVQAVLQRASSIIAQSRKERAQRGANTRRRKQVELEVKGK